MTRARLVLVMLVGWVNLALAQPVGPEGAIGALLEPDPLGVLVGEVAPGGPAEQAGLQPGDRVLALAGQSLAGRGWALVLAQWRRPVGSRARLTVRRGQLSWDVELTWVPLDPQVVQAEEARVRQSKTVVAGVIEHRHGSRLVIALERPAAQAFAVGAQIGIIPEQTVVGEARVTRAISLFRLEAQLKPGSEAHEGDAVVVRP